MTVLARHAALGAALLLLALPAAAQDAGPSGKRKPLDPNETVCKKEEVLGSRLAVRRVCMTRAQWAERQRTDRQTVERSQTQLCVPQNGACTVGQ